MHTISENSWNHRVFLSGMRAGIPIGLGYLAVSFSLGIAARNAGLLAGQAFLASMLNMASAGEYAGFTAIASRSTYLGIALITLVANARYMLMSFALSQRVRPRTGILHRLFMGYGITDEIFAVSIGRPGWVSPWFMYGALAVAVPAWSFGTAAGVIAGNLLSVRLVSAFSVALYGMFLAVFIPPMKKDRVIRILIPVCFGVSWAASQLPLLSRLSEGTRIIILTVAIAAAAALLCPVQTQGEEDGHAAE